MKCPKCNGKRTICNDMWICDVCKGTGEVAEPKQKPPKQTNEEWLRTLPTDERVKEILNRGFMTEKRTVEEFVAWLKQPHTTPRE